MRVLVTGGAGYIGSVTTELLFDQGHDVAVFDNLKSGWIDAVHPKAEFFENDLLDEKALDIALAGFQPDAICHLAAEVAVGESMLDPGLHYRSNFVGSLKLLDAMARSQTKSIVFSSTAAVYGEPSTVPIPEDAEKRPINVYGQTKLAIEDALRWYGEIHGIQHISLRYFNACGASEVYGEYRDKETHIIPILLEVALGQRESFSIFGDDYPTADGSCVRDYVHVEDIAMAHVIALENVGKAPSAAYNIGTGQGYSNKQVVDSVRRVTGNPIPTTIAERRPGDPPELVASSERIRKELGWSPNRPELDDMTASAWAWRKEHPHGYK